MEPGYILRVKDRRKYLDEDEDNWACERCGQAFEEGLVIVQTARRTRSDPNGNKCFVLCGWCVDNRESAQREGRVGLYGRVVNS